MKTLILATILLFTMSLNAQGWPLLFYGDDPLAELLADGNTVAWYTLYTQTKDAKNKVTSWTDSTGNGNHLLQADTSKSPTASATGLLFDGVDDLMNATAFTLVQPEFIYVVFRNVTWFNFDNIFDGNLAATGRLLQGSGSSPDIRADVANVSPVNANLAPNTFGIVRVLFNGVNSILQVNETAADIWDCGAGNMGGFRIAASITPGQWSNIEIKEIIIRKAADGDADQMLIVNYLNTKYSVY